MNIQTIYNVEADNSGYIYLYKIGKFYKVYEKSAMLFTLNIKNYVVRKKHYKNINADLVELGFPVSVLDNYKNSDEFEIVDMVGGCTIKPKIAFKKCVEDFDNWKSLVDKQPDNFDDAFVKMATIKPNFYTGGPRQLLLLCEEYNKLTIDVVGSMQRVCRYTHGDVVIENSYQMYRTATFIVNNQDNYEKDCRKIVECGNDNMLRIRLLHTLKYVDIKSYERMTLLFFQMKRVMEENIKTV